MSRQCFKVSNNKFFNCPALMSDGRAFTDYRESSYINNSLLNNNNFNSSYQYRQWLIHNATKLMANNNAYNNRLNSCGPCNAPPIPLQGVCEVNGYVPKCGVTNNNGLGLGYVATNMPVMNYAPVLQKDHFGNSVSLASPQQASFVPYQGISNKMCGGK